MTNTYYKKHKEKLQREAHDRYQILDEKKMKKQKRQYAREQYKNLSGEETEKKHHYGRGRHKDLLEDEYKIFF